MRSIWNFSAGPAALPQRVRERVAEALAMPGDGAPSIVEVSHRGAQFAQVVERLESGLRRLMGLPDTHVILLLQGGAHLQFAMLPINLARARPAAYLISGYWGMRAKAEAARVTDAVEVGSNAATGFRELPELGHLSPACAYLHYTGNETIHGVQFDAPPVVGLPLAADLSSEFLSRPYAYSELGLAYAGAQKNLGVAGLTVVLIRRDLLARIPDGLPAYLDYRTWVESGSLSNTPCSFAWFVAAEVVDWIEAGGGLAPLGQRNLDKCRALYAAIDRSGFYRNDVSQAARSRMNVPFFTPTAELDRQFVEAAQAEGLVGLKGHRALGGLRASLYNAVPMEAVHCLVEFMQAFERRFG